MTHTHISIYNCRCTVMSLQSKTCICWTCICYSLLRLYSGKAEHWRDIDRQSRRHCWRCISTPLTHSGTPRCRPGSPRRAPWNGDRAGWGRAPSLPPPWRSISPSHDVSGPPSWRWRVRLWAAKKGEITFRVRPCIVSTLCYSLNYPLCPHYN